MRPDVILSDLVQIFHPELAQTSAPLYFYNRLTPLTSTAGIGPCDVVSLPLTPPSGQAYITARYRTIGATQHVFLDNLYRGLKASIMTAVGATSSSSVEAFISNNPPPNSSSFVIQIHTAIPSCYQACGQGSGTGTECNIDQASALQSVGMLIKNMTGAMTVSLEQPGVTYLCTNGDRVTLQQVAGTASSSSATSSSLSTSAVAGIIVGAVVAVLLIVVASVVAYRQGGKIAYSQMKSRLGHTKADGLTMESPTVTSGTI